MIYLSSSSGSSWTMILLLVAMVAIMYFMMIRPQSKEKKRMQAMLDSMAVGDAVLTTSGFYGVLIEINQNDVIVEFGNNRNCRIPMKKSAIVQVEKPYEAANVKPEKVSKDSKKSGSAKPVVESVEANAPAESSVESSSSEITEAAAAEETKDVKEEA